MRYSTKHFPAVLTAWTTLPRKLLGFPFKVFSNHRKPAPPLAHMHYRSWLGDWRQVGRVPVFESVHPTAQRLILAALCHEMLTFRYWGGSTPGADRSVSLGLVFQAGGYGPLYVTGYCHLRREERVFRVDRLELCEDEDGIICITE